MTLTAMCACLCVGLRRGYLHSWTKRHKQRSKTTLQEQLIKDEKDAFSMADRSSGVSVDGAPLGKTPRHRVDENIDGFTYVSPDFYVSVSLDESEDQLKQQRSEKETRAWLNDIVPSSHKLNVTDNKKGL